MDMSWHMLKGIDSILRESPIYMTLSAEEKYSVIKGLAENYSLLEGDNSEDIVGYESSWADIAQTSRQPISSSGLFLDFTVRGRVPRADE
jgi:hypothetical protein